MNDITEWLASLGLGEYAQRFVDNDIDTTVLADLDDDDLKELGVSLGHRKKMLRALSGRVGAAGTAVPASAPEAQRQDDAERRQLTVMFCDVVGSTALSARLDPEEMRDVIRAYQQACARVMPTYDGFIARFMGDGVLAYFGYPHAHEDDAARAVRAGLDIIKAVARLETKINERIEVRVGIATGLVVVGDLTGEGASQEQTVIGETPNLAARLQTLAAPGTIVVAPTTRRLIGSQFKLCDLGQHEIKGLAEPVNVWSIEGTLAPESRFDASRSGSPSGFVGRQAEMEHLLERQRLAWQGHGQLVLVTGEAGIGKSSLVSWLGERVADQPHTRLRYQCSPYHANSALYPFIGQLERAAGFESGDTAEERLDKLEAILAKSTPRAAAIVPLFAALLAIPVGQRYPPLGLSPAQQRRQTFAAFLDLLEAVARQQPLLLVFEDAHWADATSLELLDLAVDRLRHLPIMALVTFRPEFEPSWIGLSNVSMLTLGRLEQAHAQTMVEQVAGGRKLPAQVMGQILAKTDGIPLFVEELTKTVLESGILVEGEGGYRLDAPLPPFAIPATLQDSLMARLDRLAPVKEVAQIGAAIGREFSYDLIKAMLTRNEAGLESALTQLEEAGLIFRHGEPPDAVYRFKHALVQDTAYESLLKSKRQILHQRIADVLRERFAAIAETHPEVVAHHLTQAGLAEAAIQWWGKAGEQALRRSAYIEAIAHLGKAISLAEGLAATPQQRMLRLRLEVALGNALIHARGLGSLEAKAAFARARELAGQVQDAEERFSVYYGLWVGSCVRGELAPMREMAEQFIDDAERRPGSPEVGIAHRIYGVTCWYQGDFVGAREHLERALAAYDKERDRPLALRFGQDVGVSAMIYLGFALFPLGEVTRARELMEQALAVAEESGHIPTQAYAHGLKCLYEGMRHDPARGAPCSEAMLRLGHQHGLSLYVANGAFLNGWTSWYAGEREAGEAQMAQGLALTREIGMHLLVPAFHALKIDTQAKAGRVDAALETLKETFALMDRTGERWFEAELHRRHGELLLARADPGAAESALLKALSVAESQAAKTFALRAALSLANLRCAAGRNEEATAVLVPALAGLGEGPELPEVGEAYRLIASLKQGMRRKA